MNYTIKYSLLDRYDKENSEAREGFIYQFFIESTDYYTAKKIADWARLKFGYENTSLIGGSSSNKTGNRIYFEIVTLKIPDDAMLMRLTW
jgi:hypothetical protein